tara:strand:- start:557 stop:1111 length:555 start_codon:yes stop_codon:yes gene_type:complete
MIRRALIVFLILAAPLSGCTGAEDEHTMIPEFTVLKEDGSLITNSDYSGEAYVIVFSAQWCSNPCHNNLHNLNLSIPNITVLVVSTDLDEAPNGVTLSMWEDSVNEYDDSKELNQTLDYTFTRVDETLNFATQMDIDSPGTSIFVDSSGYEVHRQIGTFGDYNEQSTLDMIETHWNAALEGHIE